MLTPEQLKERLSFVTGSDSGVICGLNPYKSPVQLYLEKIQAVPQEDLSHKSYVMAGNYFEEGIANWFADQTGLIPYKDEKMIIHPEHDWMAGNIDRRLEDSNYLLEIKFSSNKNIWGPSGDLRGVPKMYIMQVAHYCAVADADGCYIACCLNGNELRTYLYHRNIALEEQLIDLERNFWFEHVKKEVPPIPSSPLDVVALLGHAKSIDNAIISTPEIEKKVYDYLALDNTIKLKLKMLESYKTDICAFMRENDTLMSITGEPLVTWKSTKERESFDRDKFKIDHPELDKKYTKKGKSARQFKLKIKGTEVLSELGLM